MFWSVTSSRSAVYVVYIRCILMVIWTLFSVFFEVSSARGLHRVRRQEYGGDYEVEQLDKPSKPCPYSDGKTGLCFRLVWAEDLDVRLNYENAKATCHEFGATLVMPGNRQENRFVMSILRNESLNSVWLAARRHDNPWSWRAGQQGVKIVKDQGCFGPTSEMKTEFTFHKVERTEFSNASCINTCSGYDFAALRSPDFGVFQCGCSAELNDYSPMGTWQASCPYRCSTSDLQCYEENGRPNNLRVFHVSGVDGLQWTKKQSEEVAGDCGGIDRDGELHMLDCTSVRDYICTNKTGTFAGGEKVSWTVATQRCQDSGGILAYFSGLPEAKTFLDSIATKSDDRFWVDIARFSWQWDEGPDGSVLPMKYSRWSSTGLGGARCSTINTHGEWTATKCNEVQNGFLCQKGGVVTTEKQKADSIAASTRNGIIAGVVILVVLIFIIGVIVYKCKQGHDIESVSENSPRKLRNSFGLEESEPEDSPDGRRYQIVHPHRPSLQPEEEDLPPEPDKTEEPLKKTRPVPPPKPPKPNRLSEPTEDSHNPDPAVVMAEPVDEDSTTLPVYAVPNK